MNTSEMILQALNNEIRKLGGDPDQFFDAPVAYKTVDAFQRQLWNAALHLYRDGDTFGFVDSFVYSIDAQLTRAWNEGAREVDVDPTDFTAEDTQKLDEIIANEHDYILTLAQDIEDARIANMNLDDFRSKFAGRIDLWVNRYTDTVNSAKIWFGGKIKLEWVMGATEQHCQTCAQLNGIVAWSSEWLESGIQPQNPPNGMLECEGWRCDCHLNQTDKRRSPNALETLNTIAMSKNV